MSFEDMQKFSEKYDEWWHNRTANEYELHNNILDYEAEYFEDMTLQPGSPLHDIVDLTENMYDFFSVELEYQKFTFHVEELEEGTMGETCYPERKITIAPK